MGGSISLFHSPPDVGGEAPTGSGFASSAVNGSGLTSDVKLARSGGVSFEELSGLSTRLASCAPEPLRPKSGALRSKPKAFAKGLLNDGKGDLGADLAAIGGAADFAGTGSDFAGDVGVSEGGVVGVVVDAAVPLGTTCWRVSLASLRRCLRRESSVLGGVEEVGVMVARS